MGVSENALDKCRGMWYNKRMEAKNLAMGLRKPPTYILTESEIESLKADITAIGADIECFVFNSKFATGTCFIAKYDKIHIKGNVLSDNSSNHPRDLMSARAVLAHEYYGHRPYIEYYNAENMGEVNAIPIWADEFRANYMAAKNTPNLTEIERYYLILDALERAKEAGVSVKYNSFIRSVLYGNCKKD